MKTEQQQGNSGQEKLQGEPLRISEKLKAKVLGYFDSPVRLKVGSVQPLRSHFVFIAKRMTEPREIGEKKEARYAYADASCGEILAQHVTYTNKEGDILEERYTFYTRIDGGIAKFSFIEDTNGQSEVSVELTRGAAKQEASEDLWAKTFDESLIVRFYEALEPVSPGTS